MGRIRSTEGEVLRPRYQVEAEVVDSLDNWGRWAAPRFGCGVHTSAMFRLYRAKASPDDAAPPPLPVPVDADSAWAVEKVVCNPGFMPRFRHLLSAHYVFKTDMRSTARLLALHRDEYEAELWRASYFFWNRYKNA